MDTITRTFPLTLTSISTTAIVEFCHFRNMTFDSDERVGIYLEAWMCNLSLKSFALGHIPEFDGSESEIEKMSKFNAAEAKSQKVGLRILDRKDNAGDWQEKAEIILINRGRKDYFDLLQPYLAKNTVRILEKNDALAVQLIDYGHGLLKVDDSVGIELGITITISQKKNRDIFNARLAALELALENRLINVPANSLLGRDTTTGTIQTISQSRFATPAQIEQAIVDLVGGAPGALNTLIELARALNNDANFGTTVINALATKVGITGDETINGVKTFASAIKTPYLEKDINIKLTTGVNWTTNTWYTIPGLIIPYLVGETRLYLLTVNYQYNNGSNSYTHWQIGGNCFLPGGIGWKYEGTRTEIIMNLQHHRDNDNFFTFRSGFGNQERNLEIKTNFNIIINGLGFIEFMLKRIM
jgi:hypothetical protein